MTKDERLELIRRISRKITLEEKSKRAMMAMPKKGRKSASNKSLEKLFSGVDDSENINRWSDADDYARGIAGEVYEATTKFDNEWN